VSASDDRRRFERKYPLTAAELRDFRWWHRTHGRDFARTYDDRTIHNVYFDSPDWERHGDNLSGTSSRTKCRLRWYGELEAAETVVFEAKHRRNAVGHKDQHALTATDLGLADLPLARLYERLRPLLPGELRLELDQGHRPALYNRYRREYYATPSGIRMTVDTGIAYAPVQGGSLRNLRPMPSAAPTVVELKYSSDRRAEAEVALRRLPFRATRSSKYVIGVDHLLPH
jgi:hypothetical protein